MQEPANDDVEVSVPARAEFVRLLRMVAATVAAQHDLTFDAIEDLRIAVDEAAAQLLPVGGTTLALRLTPTADGIRAEVTTDAFDAPWPPDGIERSLAWQVLKGLSDEVAMERGDRGPLIRITKRALGAAAGS
ncbi:MAG TPA: ATP-binding protein [Actinomycetota bacterium]